MVTWDAIGSTASASAINNVGQFAFPVYLADGTLVTTSTTSTGLWSGSLQKPIDEDLSGALQPHFAVFTGTKSSGVASADPLGNFSNITIGNSSSTNAVWVQGVAAPNFLSERMYGISEVLTVVPEPSTLLMAGTAIIAGCACGWFRRRSDARQRQPIGYQGATMCAVTCDEELTPRMDPSAGSVSSSLSGTSLISSAAVSQTAFVPAVFPS